MCVIKKRKQLAPFPLCFLVQGIRRDKSLLEVTLQQALLVLTNSALLRPPDGEHPHASLLVLSESNPLRWALIRLAGLLEISLQQTLQSHAVAGLVTGHLVDGVVDGIQAVLLGADSQIELALGCAELAVNTPDRKSNV